MIYPHFVGDGARGYNIVVEAKVNAIEKTFEKILKLAHIELRPQGLASEELTPLAFFMSLLS